MWKLISYSELKIPLNPYKFIYGIGIVENERGQRIITQIDKKYFNKLSIGINGGIESFDGINGEINLFVPEFGDVNNDSNKVAIITGSSRGIGRSIAIELAKNGFDIVVNNNIKTEEGIETVNEIKKITNAIFVMCDITDSIQVNRMIEDTISKFGRIDILINNAGIAIDKRFENMSLDQWNEVISVNLTGAFNCTKSVVRYMQVQGSGKIINISSIIGQIGNVGQANYSASKGGLIAFTKSIAKEYAKDGIVINAIAPGFIRTKMIESIPKGVLKETLRNIPLGRLGEPEEVAKLVCYLSSDDANYITGQVFNINGGMYV